MKRCKIEELADTVAEMLEEYKEEVDEELHKDVKSVAKQCVKDIKAKAPKRTGAYKKSWTSHVEESRHDIKATVYSKAPEYRKTHLLEFGHKKRNSGTVKAYPHIAEAEQKASDSLVNKVKVGISRL